MTMRYESPEGCEYSIGVAPNRLRIGLAMDDHREPHVVLWQESEQGWGSPMFVPSRFAHMVVAEAMQAAMVDGEWLFDALAPKAGVQ